MAQKQAGETEIGKDILRYSGFASGFTEWSRQSWESGKKTKMGRVHRAKHWRGKSFKDRKVYSNSPKSIQLNIDSPCI